ncbi:hypothetical protein L204_101572 [Cryptococcus depauperatus]
MSNLKAYLAANYMSGPKADVILAHTDPAHKKRKKKKPQNQDYERSSAGNTEHTAGGLVLKDEDDSWARQKDQDEDDDSPVIGKELATFKRTKSQWSTVAKKSAIPLPQAVAGPSSPPDIKPDIDIKNEPKDDDFQAQPVQITKRRGGLRTAAQLKEDAEREAAAMRSPSPDNGKDQPDPTATVHRDATGRVIDIEQLRIEEKAKEEQERLKELERKEWTKGVTQRRQREEQTKLESEMTAADVGRSRDDVKMNKEMQNQERWNDPAAAFLTKNKKKGPRKPKYQKPWAPNRYGIPPGFRWDGVDRSNGFEKKYFQAQNSRARQEYEYNQWSMEDM